MATSEVLDRLAELESIDAELQNKKTALGMAIQRNQDQSREERYKHFSLWDRTKINRLNREKADIIAELSEIKQKRSKLTAEREKLKRQLNADNPARQHIHLKGGLDEFDLSNALSEPQGLVRRLVSELEKMCERYGMTDERRKLIEASRDYMQRHAITL